MKIDLKIFIIINKKYLSGGYQELNDGGNGSTIMNMGVILVVLRRSEISHAFGDFFNYFRTLRSTRKEHLSNLFSTQSSLFRMLVQFLSKLMKYESWISRLL